MDDPTVRLPVILLTGFLGAGKTTLLLRWLAESPATGLRMGVVMNEFGQESVDSQLIQRPGLPIRQVDGGCVCCAPESDLDRACRELVRSGLCDYLVLETSGLADPDNVIDVLTDPDLLGSVRLQAVVTVLDAWWYARSVEGPAERVLARRQVEFATVVCLSRCDQLGDAEILQVEAAVREINPRARVIRLPYGLPEIGPLLAAPAAEREVQADGEESDASREHLHQRYQSVTWRFPTPVSRSAFEAFLAGMDDREVVRAKGFVRFREQPGKVFLFQSLWGRHLIEEFPAKPDPETFAVLIGPSLDAAKHQARLRALVARPISLLS
jgi:G3E family GTPase